MDSKDSKITLLASQKRLFIDATPLPSPTSATVVFLHGLGSSTTFYEASLALSGLAATHQTIRYDFDGHGLSPVSGEAVSIDSLVEDLREVLDALGVERAGIIAHSMSGLVASTFAARYPSRVSKLCAYPRFLPLPQLLTSFAVLIGPVKAMPPAGAAAMLARASTVRTSGLSAIVYAVIAAGTSPETKLSSLLSLALIRALVLPTPVEGYARACEALAKATDPDWSKVEAETLIIGGAADYLSSKEVIGVLVEEMQKARTVELKGVGHWHAVEAPEKVGELLREFFEV